MNKAKTIDLLKMAVPIKALVQQEYAEFIEAVNMAIKVLESEPCEDAVSRKDVIGGFCDRCDTGLCNSSKCCKIEWIRDLPSVTPKQKIGEWRINSDGYYPYCSECKEEPKNRKMTKYCPNCGAKMGSV